MGKHRPVIGSTVAIIVAVTLAAGGCAGITHTPICPEQAALGETVNIRADVHNPGAVPRFLWEVIPENGGTFGNERSTATTFTPAVAGQITLKLSAADGLFMYTNQCVINVTDANVEVSLLVNPVQAVIGNSVLMTCSSVGDDPATSFSITQTAGQTVELIPILPGIVAFDAEIVGTYTFQCVGTSAGGVSSEPAAGTVTVSERGGRDPTR